MMRVLFRCLILCIGVFFCGCGTPENRLPATGIVRQGIEGRYVQDDRTTLYISPLRILWQQGMVRGADYLLRKGDTQLTTNGNNACVLENRGGENAAILFDFGKELQGGIKISAAIRADQHPVKVRVRLGESVSEAMSSIEKDPTASNDHAMRDYIIEVPWLGEVEIGNSGFRFARIELLDDQCVLPLQSVRAVFRFRELDYLGSFACSDQRLNRIWETGAYTVHLNMQDYVWDGIKRDRLVWLGDLHPELMTINTVFGDQPVLRATLDFGRDHCPLPGWMNGISSYSLWWIISHRDFYMYQGDRDYLREQQEYLNVLTGQILDKIDGNREAFDGQRFLDWPTSENPEVIHAGLQSLCLMALEAAADMAGWLDDPGLKERSREAADRLRTHIPDHAGNKQAAALLAISGLADAARMKEVVLQDGVRRFSTFYGYYMLEALARAGAHEEALRAISDYWGIMLDLGATTFWEDLDYDDALKASRIDELVPEGGFDIHSQSGAYCYEGLRHSFCHGWASGPTAWLSRYVLGISPAEPGFRSVSIEPRLGGLEWAEGTFPTPLGLISVEHRKDPSGQVSSRITAPKGMKVLPGETIARSKISYR